MLVTVDFFIRGNYVDFPMKSASGGPLADFVFLQEFPISLKPEMQALLVLGYSVWYDINKQAHFCTVFICTIQQKPGQ